MMVIIRKGKLRIEKRKRKRVLHYYSLGHDFNKENNEIQRNIKMKLFVEIAQMF